MPVIIKTLHKQAAGVRKCKSKGCAILNERSTGAPEKTKNAQSRINGKTCEWRKSSVMDEKLDSFVVKSH